jgi:hypothetical protein
MGAQLFRTAARQEAGRSLFALPLRLEALHVPSTSLACPPLTQTTTSRPRPVTRISAPVDKTVAFTQRASSDTLGDRTRAETLHGRDDNPPAGDAEVAPRSHGHAKGDDPRRLATSRIRHHYVQTRKGRPPPHVHGKEGVDGSSPSEGLTIPGNRQFVLSVLNHG